MYVDRISLDALHKIYESIPLNYNRYMNSSDYWLIDFLTENGYQPEPRGMDVKDFVLQIDSEEPSSTDFYNAKILYDTLDLEPELASNGAFWTIIAHHNMDYIRSRGRYFLKTKEEAINRLRKDVCFSDYLTKRERRESYICRLWSIADLTFDKSDFDNPYEFLEVAFKDQDLVNTILDRDIFTNRQVTRAFLEIYRDQLNKGSKLDRRVIRDFQVYLQALSDVYVIEAMSLEDLREKFKEFIDWEKDKKGTGS